MDASVENLVDRASAFVAGGVDENFKDVAGA